tara:strand:- start:146 stop:445 length:300 start_codon:yes stop_codon:yes gene_type:complete
MLNVNNLKLGDRVQFAPNTLAQVTNYETDISSQFGTVVNFTISHDGTYDTHVWIELDERNEHFDCDEWGNAVQFNLTDEMDGGTSVDYLKKAKLLKGVA